MSSSSTQFVIPNRIGIYEPFLQATMWDDHSFKVDSSLSSAASPMLMADASPENKQPKYIPQNSRAASGDDQEPNTSVLRRLAQNREAARKSRLRKKAYVKQLETSRMKLMQLELEIEKARKQGFYIGSPLDASYLGQPGTITGVAAFEIEYGHWVEEQHRQNAELRIALENNASDAEIQLVVESVLSNYSNLFRIKGYATKADVFYLLSGVWKSSVERMFLWIGGSRPSELLNMVLPQVQPLDERQIMSVNSLRLSSQQAEDALSQGLEKLQQSLVHDLAADPLSMGNEFLRAAAMEKIEALEGFVNQADHLRQQTLQQMSRILTTLQAAQGLLALGEYFHRLRALSSVWSTRPCDSPALFPNQMMPLHFTQDSELPH